MTEKEIKLIENLNHEDINIRLSSLEKLKELIDKGEIKKVIPKENQVNNHIHTNYSFSPYSPTKAIYLAYQAGLITAGIMDHDSISGAQEFIKAGEIMGIATTIGVECRTDFSNTPLKGRRINNPDQKSVTYVALHGIPHTKINQVANFFRPYTEARNRRNQKMVAKINQSLEKYNVSLDFKQDVVPLSKSKEGGSITERHILFALAHKLIDVYGKGKTLLNFLKSGFNLNIDSKSESYLLDKTNQIYAYDLLNLLKKELVSSFYIEAKEECPEIRKVISLAEDISAISAYAYLGDIEESVTGDKKSQKFEDDYLDLLFKVLKELNFRAVTYMPTRNTISQLKRLKTLCNNYNFLQISGEDINSPRQSFICEALKQKEFANLISATWALIGHEKKASIDVQQGMFSKKIINKYPDLEKRIEIFKKYAQEL